MTIIHSPVDFDARILFNSPLSFLLHITNPSISGAIYHKQKQLLSLKETKHNPLTSLKFINHDIAIRTQYFLEWRLIAICFSTFTFSYFSINPLLMFYTRYNWADEIGVTAARASLMYTFFYGSCIVSLILWMCLARLQIWNMGIFANINHYHHRSSSDQPELSQEQQIEMDANARMRIVNFKRNSYESRINGYLICLRWLLFGYVICLFMLCVAQNFYHAVMAIMGLGVFYPNLLITSGSVLMYSIDQLNSVKYAHLYIAVSIILGWLILPLLTAVIAEYISWWAPFIFIGCYLSLCLLYLMCIGPGTRTQFQINGTDDPNIIGSALKEDVNAESIPLKQKSSDSEVSVDRNDKPQKLDRQQSRSDGIFSDSSMVFQRSMAGIAEDTEFGFITQEREASIWRMVGCEGICRFNPSIMSASIGMFQVSTFLLNIESFLTNICLSLYFTWYSMAIWNDLDQNFIVSTVQMGITGVLVLFCIIYLSRFIYKLYYYYSFRIWINLCCIVLSIIMSSYHDTAYLYWILIPIIFTFIVLLNVSTNLIINSNAPNGCYTFINASNQIFQLSAFMIGPLLMGLPSSFDDGLNTYTFWRIITAVLALQLSVTILTTFIQGFISCFCAKNSNNDQHNNTIQQL